MLYLIGLGLGLNSASDETIGILKKCKKVYLENYTVEFPYTIDDLENSLGKGKRKILSAGRDFVESMKIVDEAGKKNVALLVYGSPLTATTHISLIQECRKRGIKFRILHNSSVFDAVAETGLQIYKFGKIASMPHWDAKKHFMPDSFMEIVKENQKANAHSLILIDIGLAFSEALDELEKSAKSSRIKIKDFAVCSRLGTPESEILYGSIDRLKNKKVKAPFCFVIPGKMHFVEEEVLENFRIDQKK